jgi:hypothetical protein
MRLTNQQAQAIRPVARELAGPQARVPISTKKTGSSRAHRTLFFASLSSKSSCCSRSGDAMNPNRV